MYAGALQHLIDYNSVYLYILFTIEIPKEFLRGMFLIKTVFSVFQN
jgi:hypothetical protein